MIAGLIAAATATVIAWAMSGQTQAVRTYDGIEAGQLGLEGIGRLVRNAGAGGQPALLQVTPDRLVLCGVWWGEQVVRGQVLVDPQGRLVFTAVAPPSPGQSRCPGQDLAETVNLVPGAAFRRVTFSTVPSDGTAAPASCGTGPGMPGCDGVVGVYVLLEVASGNGGSAPGAAGYLALRNAGGR